MTMNKDRCKNCVCLIDDDVAAFVDEICSYCPYLTEDTLEEMVEEELNRD